MNEKSYKVVSFYKFSNLIHSNIETFREIYLNKYINKDIKGIVLLSEEGINGTICGQKNIVEDFISKIRILVSSPNINHKTSWSENQIFKKLKIRIKKEIITIGNQYIKPINNTGEYVKPEDWNNYLLDKNTLVVDTRNNYEISIGTFRNSINPNTRTFTAFPKWLDKELIPLIRRERPKRIAMFCTGGIRCEKATSLLKDKGFQNVYHLEGGILKYLEEVPEANSLWEGECFVFDKRVSLNHSLEKGNYILCYACGMPLCEEEIKGKDYIKGVQCYHCKNKYTDQDRYRFKERQKQLDKIKQEKEDFS
tara:strand:- start:9027 stop:9953 length:927 start_codon:yes stop_codon:yes gene_type:complete